MSMRKTNIVESFNCAIEGLIYVLRTQRNMRIHILFAVFILVLGIYLNLAAMEMVALCVVITLVICSELINTATEYTLDLLTHKFNPLARITKDISAAGVLITSINAVVVGYLIFSKYLGTPIGAGILRVKQSPWHITFISLILVLGAVVTGKVLLHRGRPLRGGMPSGHSAVAFSIWTVIAFASRSELAIVLSFFLAGIIAWSRVRASVHTIWEMVCGSLVGILITTLVIQMLQ